MKQRQKETSLGWGMPKCLCAVLAMGALFAGLLQPAPAMIFGPKERPHRLWDCWVIEEEGVRYLYYLTSSSPTGPFDGISVATSVDGVHWEDHGLVVRKSAQAEWMGTGFTWRNLGAPGRGKYIMNFSERRADLGSSGELVQHVFFAESDDLLHWKRLPDAMRSSTDGRYYSPTNPQRWDCIFALPRTGGDGYWGYLTARPLLKREGHVQGAATRSIGMLESRDGVVWAALPPPVIEWGDEPESNWEVGGVAELDGRYFLLTGTGGYKGNSMAMWTFVSESPLGPFRPQKGAFRLLGSIWPHRNTYFARFYESSEGLLVVHHSIPRPDQQYDRFGQRNNRLAPMKRAVIGDDGLLRLGWWEGNARLKGARLPMHDRSSGTAMRMEAAPAQAVIRLLPGELDLARGVMMEGEIVLEPRAGVANAAFGVYIDRDNLEGTALVLRTDGRTECGPVYHDGHYRYAANQRKFQVEDAFARGETAGVAGLSAGTTHRFRLLLRESFLELYLDDVLVQCVSLPLQTTKRVGFFVESAEASIRDLEAWQMTLQPQS